MLDAVTAPLRARAERAEAEETRLHQLANRLLAANEGLVATIRSLDKEELCDWHDGIGGDEYLAQWLQQRDDRMKKLGAALELRSLVDETTRFSFEERQWLYQKAARLRAEAGKE